MLVLVVQLVGRLSMSPRGMELLEERRKKDHRWHR
jgi:hypothetical protein